MVGEMMELVYYCHQDFHTKECFKCGSIHSTPCDICYIRGCPKCQPDLYIDSKIAVLRQSADIELAKRKERSSE